MSKSVLVSFVAPFVMERDCATRAQTIDNGHPCKNLASLISHWKILYLS